MRDAAAAPTEKPSVRGPAHTRLPVERPERLRLLAACAVSSRSVGVLPGLGASTHDSDANNKSTTGDKSTNSATTAPDANNKHNGRPWHSSHQMGVAQAA